MALVSWMFRIVLFLAYLAVLVITGSAAVAVAKGPHPLAQFDLYVFSAAFMALVSLGLNVARNSIQKSPERIDWFRTVSRSVFYALFFLFLFAVALMGYGIVKFLGLLPAFNLFMVIAGYLTVTALGTKFFITMLQRA